MARRRSLRRLDMRTAAAPTRKRQLGMSMARSLPKYQFCVMFSVLITSALLLGYTCRQTPTPHIPALAMQHSQTSETCPSWHL